jgi:acetyltransferase-like isoleucine patch superfamily enzyme
MMRKIIRKIKEIYIIRILLSTIRKIVARVFLKPGATIDFHRNALFLSGRISVGKNSFLSVGRDSIVDCNIYVGDNCRVSIGNNCALYDMNFTIRNSSVVELDDGAILNGTPNAPLRVGLDNGMMHLGSKTHIQGEITVRFGGGLKIGRYTGVGNGSSIFCEERIDIGEYGLISYDVCILDTDNHSLDWQDRRKIIQLGYPVGALEEKRPDEDKSAKPKTKPVWIGNDVWIGKGSTITKGCVIGSRSIIGMRTSVGGTTIDEDSIVVSQRPRLLPRKINKEF